MRKKIENNIFSANYIGNDNQSQENETFLTLNEIQVILLAHILINYNLFYTYNYMNKDFYIKRFLVYINSRYNCHSSSLLK